MSDSVIHLGSVRRTPSLVARTVAVGAIVVALAIGVVIGRVTASPSAAATRAPRPIDARWIDDARTSVRWRVMHAMNGLPRSDG